MCNKVVLRPGMTFIEVLIAVAILTVVAMIVVPEMSEASSDVLEEKLREDLLNLRHQIQRYREDHGGKIPEGVRLIAQLTLRTNAAGEIMPAFASPDEYPFGPYLERFPENPFVLYPLSHRVETHAFYPGGESAGWFYNSQTGQICPDDKEHVEW